MFHPPSKWTQGSMYAKEEVTNTQYSLLFCRIVHHFLRFETVSFLANIASPDMRSDGSTSSSLLFRNEAEDVRSSDVRTMDARPSLLSGLAMCSG